jgi:hypothetical protein
VAENLHKPVDGKNEAEGGLVHGDKEAGKVSARSATRKKTGVEIYDYILAVISGLEFAWQLFKKLSGNSTREWLWVLLPLFLVFGLLQHKTVYRVICSILLFGSILLTIILMGMVSGY